MTVGEIAKRVGVGPQTVRYYEKRGLLPKPSRWGPGDYRDFDEDALNALRFIQGAKAAGFTLAEIKNLAELRLPPRGSCREVGAFFETKISELDHRIANLRRMRTTLHKMLNACGNRKRDETCLALWRVENLKQ